ncbi:MAG: hypothetical protein ACR2MF_01510 [Chthoniobacterales bacterium]
MTTRSLLSTTAALFLALSLPAFAADPSPDHKMDMSAMMKDKGMMRQMCAEMAKDPAMTKMMCAEMMKNPEAMKTMCNEMMKNLEMKKMGMAMMEKK